MELTTIAKPYVNAIFAIAQQNQSFYDWGQVLQAGAKLADDATLKEFLASTKTSKTDKHSMVIGLFESILGRELNAQELSFVGLVLKNGRINALPSMFDLFTQMSNFNSNVQLFNVISAYQLNAQEQQKIIDGLSAKYNTKVSIDTEIDESLVGGVVIKQGDKVIDLSIQARVNALGLCLSVAH